MSVCIAPRFPIERPVLFNGAMVRAILSGAKTQTRRPCPIDVGFLGSKDEIDNPDAWGYAFDGKQGHGYLVLGRGHRWRQNHDLQSIPHPHGEAGDRLWVRETFSHIRGNGIRTWYRADGEPRDSSGEILPTRPGEARWFPSIHMPRHESRITLEVSSVGVERLQDLSESDAVAEGFERRVSEGMWLCVPNDSSLGAYEKFVEPDFEEREGLAFYRKNADCVLSTARDSFWSAWNSIYSKKSGLAWADNPWVWVTTFKRMERA